MFVDSAVRNVSSFLEYSPILAACLVALFSIEEEFAYDLTIWFDKGLSEGLRAVHRHDMDLKAGCFLFWMVTSVSIWK